MWQSFKEIGAETAKKEHLEIKNYVKYIGGSSVTQRVTIMTTTGSMHKTI